MGEWKGLHRHPEEARWLVRVKLWERIGEAFNMFTDQERARSSFSPSRVHCRFAIFLLCGALVTVDGMARDYLAWKDGDEYVLYRESDTSPLLAIRLGEDPRPIAVLPHGVDDRSVRHSAGQVVFRVHMPDLTERIIGVARLGSPVVELHRIEIAGWSREDNGWWGDEDVVLAANGQSVFVDGGRQGEPAAIWEYRLSSSRFGKVVTLKPGITYGRKSCSPDGNRLALIWGEDQLVNGYFWCTAVMIDLAKQSAVYPPISLRVDQGFHGGAPAWSPQATWLMIGGDRFEENQYRGSLTVMDPKTQAIRALADLCDFGGWMDDETFLARHKDRKRWSVIHVSGKDIRELPQDGRPFHEPGSKYLLGVKGTAAEPKNELWNLEGNTVGSLPARCGVPRPYKSTVAETRATK